MWPTILVSAVLVAILTAIVVCWIKRKKSGKSSCSCGGNCGACGLCGSNHQNTSGMMRPKTLHVRKFGVCRDRR